MNLKERCLAVFRGAKPDYVPWFADLSHWQAAETKMPFIPLAGVGRDASMVDLHREVEAGLYLNMGSFWDIYYDEGVEEEAKVEGDCFLYRIATPVGVVEEHRQWSVISSSWDITKRMIRSPEDLEVITFAFERRRARPAYERYHEWEKMVGVLGVPFAVSSYSGLGFLMSRYMGVEATVYGLADFPALMRKTIGAINAARLREVDVMVGSPSPVILFTDNLSSDIHSPPLFREHAAAFYSEMCRRAHAAGKYVSVHVDGRLRGLLGCLRECGVDCIDATTPKPDGDLTPDECRDEAGDDMILWGGIPPSMWRPETPEEDFIRSVRNWLALKERSRRLVLAPGDQVIPGAPRRRIEMVPELVERYGAY